LKQELIEITKKDRKRIISIFLEDDVRVYNQKHDRNDSMRYFVVKLDDETQDQFYDHSVPIGKIFKELSCVPTGFKFNNDYYEEGDVNTYYGIWFSKLRDQQSSTSVKN